MRVLAFCLMAISFFSCRSRSVDESAISKLPSFKMRLLDSVTLLSADSIPAGRPVVLIFFRPDCSHCKRETQAILDHAGMLKDISILMVTNSSFFQIRDFYESFHLDRYRNVEVGKDYEHSFYQAFRPTSVPFTVIYNRERRLIKIYSEEADIKNILTAIRI